MTANEITATLLIEIPKRFPNVRVWRNNRIDAMVTGRNGKLRRVKAGVDGQADITGIARVPIYDRIYGIRLEIEVKAGRDRMSTEQKAFREMIESHGGVYIVARDAEEALAELGRRLLWNSCLVIH